MMLRNPGFTLFTPSVLGLGCPKMDPRFKGDLGQYLGFTPSVLGLGCPKMDPRFKGDLGQFRCADHAYEVII
jgi:hypothetical protein